jgi:methyltransferase (TIGR00027 family)
VAQSAPTPLVRSVSDTARWVAMYRAMETARPDALFRDPYARQLAGDRGEEMVRLIPRARDNAWAMIVRTAVFDEIILRAVQCDGVDVVLNLAAGLDVRPYRLPLPPTLRWIDVDLPEILAYKQEVMAGERPACVVETVPADLSDTAVRRALFARVAAGAQRVFVVTEGLLVYLPREQVAALATDLLQTARMDWWLVDLASRGVLRLMQRRWQPALAGGAQMQFAPPEGPAFFERLGWRVAEFRLSLEEAHRLHREMAMAWLFRPLGRLDTRRPQERSKWRTGFLLLERPPNARSPRPA